MCAVCECVAVCVHGDGAMCAPVLGATYVRSRLQQITAPAHSSNLQHKTHVHNATQKPLITSALHCVSKMVERCGDEERRHYMLQIICGNISHSHTLDRDGDARGSHIMRFLCCTCASVSRVHYRHTQTTLTQTPIRASRENYAIKSTMMYAICAVLCCAYA